MLVAARASFFISRAKRWTNPYVADGLIAMWDAVWNAGPGVHDASATTWKNLVDGSSFGDGASAASYRPVWGDDYCRNQAGASGQKQVFSVSATLAATQSIVCAEEVARAVSKAADVSSGWHEIQRFSIGVGFFRGDIPTFGVLGNIVLWPSATQYQPWRTYNSTISSSLDPYVRRSYHSSRSGSTPYMRVDGGTRLTMTRGNGNTLGVPTAYPLIMSHSCVLEACCIRLYSRELTADEIAANLAIDRARFNLP